MITLIDFYADWCAPCKIMAPIFEEIKGSYKEKVEFKKVNVEENPQMAAKYGVMGIPTFIILKDEEVLDKKVGAMPKEILTNWIDSNL